MTSLLSLLVITAAVAAILRGAEVRLALLVAALALGALAGDPLAIVRQFLVSFTSEQFVLPLGCCLGFAYVLRHTGCDQHLIHLLLHPLKRVRPLLVPGVVLVGVAVNVPIVSQTGTAAAVGSVLVPVLRAANVSAATTGAALVLGASMGGELLNPGAPELLAVSKAARAPGTDCVARVWPLLLVHLAVTVPLFWLLSARADRRRPEAPAAEGPPPAEADFRVHPLKAAVPLVPLTLLFLTALPPPLRALEVPRDWLVGPNDAGSFDSRLIGAAMLVGVVAAALTSPAKVGGTAKAFFEGVGYAYTHILSLIVVANCFGKGVKESGLAGHLQTAIGAAPGLLLPAAAALPLGFAWVCGSGIAATQSLYGFFVAPAVAAGADPLRVGAVVSLAAAAGRTMSPVAAVMLLGASLTGTEPLALVRRVAPPLLAGVAAVVATAVLTY